MIPNGLKKQGIDLILAIGTPKAMLLNNTHVSDIDTQQFIDDVSTNEVSGTGYTAGGQTLTNITSTQDNTNDRVDVDCDDLTWSSLTVSNIRYVVFYVDSGTPATSPILSIQQFPSVENRTVEDLQITIASGGFLRIA